MANNFIFLLIIKIALLSSCQFKLQTGQENILPQDIHQSFKDLEQFEIGLWNHLLVPKKKSEENLCSYLKSLKGDYLKAVMCKPSLNDHKDKITAWLKDQFFFFPPPTQKELVAKANLETSKLALLIGAEGRSLLEVSRLDPLNLKETFLNKVSTLNLGTFQWDQGHLYNKEKDLILIPIQFSYPAEDTNKTKLFLNKISKWNPIIIGRHRGFEANKSQVEQDLKNVTILTIVLFSLLFIFLYTKKLLHVSILLFPTLIGIITGISLVHLIYGGIHGLTISFGAGITGLSLDYGLHNLFLKNKKEVWKSNFYGLVTTLIVFIIFSFSSIPLLKQMMLFCTSGIFTSFLFTWIFFKEKHLPHSFSLKLNPNKIHQYVFYCSILGLLLVPFAKLELYSTRFDFTPEKERTIKNWFFKNWSKQEVFFKLYSPSEFSKAFQDYAKTPQSIRQESVFNYIKDPKDHLENLKKWKEFDLPQQLNEKLFSPFIQAIKNKDSEQGLVLNSETSYIKHLVNKKNLINLWFSNSPKEAKEIEKNHPDAISLKKIMIQFTKNLIQEIYLFMPITLIFIFMILFTRYKKFKPTIMSLIPFLFALSVYTLAQRLINFPVSMMSLLGIFLIYGISVDYGIFATDYHKKTEKDSLQSALLLSWLSSLCGFLPLIFCQHKILFDLALAVLIGLVAILYSTFFIIPSFQIKMRGD